MRHVKRYLLILACLIAVLAIPRYAWAEEIASEREYKPLDLVLVIDGSGSMLNSDPDRTALAAGRMLTNMMPAADSRVAIVSFNTKPTTHTQNSSGSGSIVSLDSFSNVESIRDAIAEVKYDGDTGIGNALLAATELLQKESSDEHQQAIILFTDGVNDFGQDAIGLSQCEENEAKALQWAKKNDCVIYCVGYDYTLPSGGSSMGENGEGLVKLKNIAETTGGTFKAIGSISEMEQLLIEFMADVCDLVYKTVATIPGDGGEHSAPIDVSPSVVEIDIRIAGGAENAIANGEVHLYDPDGNEVALKNSGNVRYDVDATAASIKVVMPKSGEWKIVVKGITGDDIHVGLLEHFKMNLSSKIVFPEGNPAGVAYARDVLGVEAWLTYDGEDLQDDDVYEAVTSATATFVSRANQDDRKVVDLTRDGRVFKGSFTIPADSFYDVTVRLSWDTVYREDTLTVMSSNKPLELVRDIDDVELDNGKTTTVSNLYQYVYDEENDDINAVVSSVSDPDTVDAVVDGDSVKITGHKWSSTLITVTFTDKQGNSVESTFKAKVNDPVAMALIIGSLVLLTLVILGVIYLIYRRTFRIRGTMRVGIIKELGYKNGKVATEEVVFEDHYRLYPDGESHIEISGISDNGEKDNGPSQPEPASGPVNDDPFGADVNPFGGIQDDALVDPFGSPAPNPFDASPLDMSDPALDDPFGASGKDDPFAILDEPNDDEETQADPDVLEDRERDSKFRNGEMQLGEVCARYKSNMLVVLQAFVESYSSHMLMMRESSAMANRVRMCVGTYFTDFEKVMISGSPRGKHGIRLKLPKQSDVVIESPKARGGRLDTKNWRDRPILLKFLIAVDVEKAIYLEVEFVPAR